ncbi:MAG TPA: branched-chain amino acid ABC transporter permease [Chitinivibrionales bacterium]|nr:branched-chain amino acid ABC transporter permease [Chitinivibrionales bacterium]
MFKKPLPIILPACGLGICILCDVLNCVDPYIAQIIMYIGINIILTASLNLVNGYMGEFSVGHAAFMAVGAYGASFFSLSVFPQSPVFFPLSLVMGGIFAGAAGLLVAIPAFKARDDYLAIITLALLMIVKSAFDNLPFFGGPQGYYGIHKFTNLSWAFVWTAVTLVALRNIVNSNFGRGIIAVRDDEIAATLVSINTKQVKILAFVISSFFAGIAGGLFAHLIQFINPRTFSLVKSTDILLMLYLGGSGSLFGSILGATIWTILLEALRFLGIWRFVVAPLALIALMIFRPLGIMGGKELGWLRQKEKLS